VDRERIAHILGALDDKIDLNRRMNEALEAMARAIFKDWFVYFGPTRAKLEGRAPYLAPEIWDLFPERLDDDDKPKGWVLAALDDFSMLNPESWSRSNYPEHVDYVDLSNTKWGTIEAPERHNKETAPSRAQRVLRNGDTIVGTVRPGNGSFALVGENGLTGSTGFAVLRPRRAQCREFVYLAATSPLNIERLSHLADGAAYPAVRPEIVYITEIARAGDEIMDAFHRTTASLIDRIEANKLEARTLAATRDLLLPKLMSGEVRMKDADRIVGDVP
jgi:type I restriction enzyme S subunit